MATALTVQNIDYMGADVVFVAADPTGNNFINDGAVFLYVRNNSPSVSTVAIATAKPCNQGVTHSYNISLDTTEEKFLGYFGRDRFNDADGKINFTTTNAAAVELAAVKVVRI